MLLLLVSSAISQQPQRRTATAPKPSPSLNKPLESYVDLKAESLPPNFAGHDLKLIYAAVKKKADALHKQEFETTKEYDKRVASLAAEPVYGTITAGSTLGFVFKLSNNEVQYDADNKILSIKKYAFLVRRPRVPHESIFEPGVGSFEWAKTDIVESNYVGQNAMGAKVDVTSRSYKTYHLGFDLEPLTGDKKNRDFNIQIPGIGADSARAIKPFLAVLVICDLSNVKVLQGRDYSGATLDIPLARYEDKFYLLTRIAQVWIFDQKTGKVFSKRELVIENIPQATPKE
jgi:hypothetical protein